MKTLQAPTVDLYIASFPKDVQKLMERLRATIRKVAPKAEEVISYQMPAYKFHGMFVYFAAYKSHIGFYPGASPIMAFQKEISIYKNAKGSVQFPIDQPLPLGLVTKMVKFRLQENLEKAEVKNVKSNVFSSLSAPAQRALANKGIKTLKQLAKFSESDILKLHGMGPGSLPKLRNALKTESLVFKK